MPTSPTSMSLGTKQSADSATSKMGGLIRSMSRRVVTYHIGEATCVGADRVEHVYAQIFKSQQLERRTNLTPIRSTPEERRAITANRRSQAARTPTVSQPNAPPHASAPGLLGVPQGKAPASPLPPLPVDPVKDVSAAVQLERMAPKDDEVTLAEDAIHDSISTADAHSSIASSQYDAMIHDELEKIWILNLSMHFRDRSRREKFFVTYREQEQTWRRVTISLDYRNAPLDSLEMDLIHTKYQREKSAKIYKAVRDSLREIHFYDTVTNLKLQTCDGRLHVHVVEDGNEIIQYPTVTQIKHLGCKRIRGRDILFDSHLSGFVYKVNVHGQTLIKKDFPSPDTVDEFLYEVNALSCLQYSENVIRIYGVITDDDDEYVKGLLISYADQGALIDIIYDHCKEDKLSIPWPRRMKWARQIVSGLSDIHESGFVQGDFTLSNIVIDENGDAKIIDINRRGCPVGWEPPEARPLIECNQRISMYLGVKSDLYQLGMVLWALATQEDEPEAQGRPLILGPEVNIPDWYRQMTEICLSNDPRLRLQASSLLKMFPSPLTTDDHGKLNLPLISVDEDYVLQQRLGDYDPENHQHIRTVEPPSEWSYKPTFIEPELPVVSGATVGEKVENPPLGNEIKVLCKSQESIDPNFLPDQGENTQVFGSSTKFQGLGNKHEEDALNNAPSLMFPNDLAGSSSITVSKEETGRDEVLDRQGILRDATESLYRDDEKHKNSQILSLWLRYLFFQVTVVANSMGFDWAFAIFQDKLRTWLEQQIAKSLQASATFRGQEQRAVTERVQWGQKTIQMLQCLRNMVSDWMQPKIPSGYVRISWTCRCSKRLHIQVPAWRREAAIAFAEHANGSSQRGTFTIRDSSTNSASTVSTPTRSEPSSPSQSRDSQQSSHSTAPSIDRGNPDPFIPAGTSKFMLLCVNTGIRLIKLANIDVSDVTSEEEVFKRLSAAYYELRGKRHSNPFIKPRTMHYVKFQLLYLQQSQECVGNYMTNSIPSRKEVLEQEYTFKPCPPAHGDVPIPPDLFMHVFLNPGDHLGSMAAEMLPKKLRSKLFWDSSVNSTLNAPIGWGFYIVEGVDWLALTQWVFGFVLFATIFTIAWSTARNDVQAGTGIGQYCIAVLAVLISTVVLGYSNTFGP